MLKLLEPNSNNGAETEKKKGQEKTHLPDGESAQIDTQPLAVYAKLDTNQRQCSAKKPKWKRKLQSLEIIDGVQTKNR